MDESERGREEEAAAVLSVVALLHVVEGGRDVASPHQRRKHIFVERPCVDVDSISDPGRVFTE